MAKRFTTIKCRIQDDFVDFSFNIYQCLHLGFKMNGFPFPIFKEFFFRVKNKMRELRAKNSSPMKECDIFKHYDC